MSRLAVQVTELALAHLPAPLLGSINRHAVIAVASQLAAVPALGLECRLGHGGGPIDLSQCFRLADGAAEQLRRLSAQHTADAPPELRQAWRRIARFADFWEQAGGLIKEIWLELDMGGTPYPSIFLDFDRSVSHDADVRHALDILADDLDPSWAALCAALDRAHALGLDPGRLVGIMLSRSGALRATIKRVDAVTTRALLDQLYWTGPTAQVVDILAVPCVARMRRQLVLDFTPEMMPSCGIELWCNHTTDDAGRWQDVLDWMAACGWADPARSAGIIGWDATFGPGQAGAPWPDAMVVAGILGDMTPVVSRRAVNHVKLNIATGKAPLAKAYLSIFAETLQ